MTSAPKWNRGEKQLEPSNRGKRLASLGMMLMLGLLASSPAAAQALDGTAIEKLALQGTWAAKDSSYGNWSWSKDNTVCHRLLDPVGDCSDTGTWTINGDVMCYELTWWGSAYGIKDNCFTVKALGDDRYEALYHGGAMVSTFIHFKVLE